MKLIPSNLIIEKNRLTTTNAWIVLLDVQLENSTLYVCNNNEAVSFQGRTYTPVPFEIEPTESGSGGEIPTVTLRLSNVTRMAMTYIEQTSGLVGRTVVVRVVNSAYLSENYSELTMTFDILGTEVNAQWVVFTLGAPSPLNKRFPLYRYLANHCQWEYKGIECGYSGDLPTCKKTLEDCRNHNNSARFGGFIGLLRGQLRVVQV